MSDTPFVSDLPIHFLCVLMHFGIYFDLLKLFDSLVDEILLRLVILNLELVKQGERIRVTKFKIPDHLLRLHQALNDIVLF